MIGQRACVVIVEDEQQIRRFVRAALEDEGCRVVEADTAARGVQEIAQEKPDLVILDLGLPDLDGVDVCRRLREGRNLPIVVLSARDAERDKVAALDAGADDYVTKPFGSEELLARIRAALRRSETSPAGAGILVRGDLTIDIDRRRVTRGDEEIRLTPRELELLLFLAQRPGRVLTHRTILTAIWGAQAIDQPEHLRVLVNALRRKIEEDPARPRYVLTEPWVGYRFADL